MKICDADREKGRVRERDCGLTGSAERQRCEKTEPETHLKSHR